MTKLGSDIGRDIWVGKKELIKQLKKFGTRSNILYRKMLEFEKDKNDAMMEWTAAVQKFEYDKARDLLIKYKDILEKREKPAVKLYVGLIANHFIYMTSILRKHGMLIPKQDIKNALMIFDRSAKIQNVLIKMVADVEEEIKTVEIALEHDLPLKLLDDLKSDEVRDEALDRQLQSIRSELFANYYNIRQRYGAKLAEAEAKLKKAVEELALVKAGKAVAQSAYDKIGNICVDIQVEDERHQITVFLAEYAFQQVSSKVGSFFAGTIGKIKGWAGWASEIAGQEKKYEDMMEQIEVLKEDPNIRSYFEKHYREAMEKYESLKINVKPWIRYFNKTRNLDIKPTELSKEAARLQRAA